MTPMYKENQLAVSSWKFSKSLINQFQLPITNYWLPNTEY